MTQETLTHEQVVNEVQAGFDSLMDIGVALMQIDPQIGLVIAKWSSIWLSFMTRLDVLTEDEAEGIVLSNLPEDAALGTDGLVI